jgi:hypothetical protein
VLCATYSLLSPLIFLLFILVEYPLRVANLNIQLCITLKHNKVKLYPFPSPPTPFSFFPPGPLLKYDPYLCRARPLFHTFFASYLAPLERWATSSPPTTNSFLSYLLYASNVVVMITFTTDLSTTTPGLIPKSFFLLLFRFVLFLSIIFFPFLFPK